MNVRDIEQAARCAWPALEAEELPFGVLRYAGGTDRRVNSLSLHPGAHPAAAKLIGTTERFFGERNAVPIVRVVKSAGTSLSTLSLVDRPLECSGYEKQAPTHSMLLALTSVPRIALQSKSEPEHGAELRSWLRAWYVLTGKPIECIGVHKAILEKLAPAHFFVLQRTATGAPLSTGMGVIADTAVGVFGIATAGEYRQQSQASLVIGSLLHWAFMRGARCEVCVFAGGGVERGCNKTVSKDGI